MLGLILKKARFTAKHIALGVIAAGVFSSCASKEPPPLISDGSRTGEESTLPWNKQEKWEGQGQLGKMAEQFNSR